MTANTNNFKRQLSADDPILDQQATTDELLQIKQSLEAILSNSDVQQEEELEMAASLLKQLDNITMTLEALEHTKIGFIVNRLRKHLSDGDAAKTVAENLIKKWKKVAKTEFRKRSVSGTGTNSSPSPSDNVEAVKRQRLGSTQSDNGSTHSSNEAQYSPLMKSPLERHSSEDSSGSQDNNAALDSTRAKTVELLMAAMEPAVGARINLHDYAQKCEAAIFEEYKGVDSHYKAAVRSRVFNLRDKHNPDFRQAVLDGNISPQRLAVMQATDMAGPVMRALRRSLEQEANKEHALPDGTSGEAHSDIYKCHQCGNRDVTYNVVQERRGGEYVSATSVVCNKCGHRFQSY